MDAVLTWFGVSTFKLEIDDRVIFLDTFVDRAPEAPQVGLRSSEVERADFILLGHSHFDHTLGADTIARNTGAVIVGSYESVRTASEAEVDEHQLMPVAGGETIQLSDDVRVRVFPGLHSCIWAPSSRDAGQCLSGDTGVSHQERLHRQARRIRELQEPGPGHSHPNPPAPRGDGGALVYLIETPGGAIWWNDTSGYWSWVTKTARAQVAILAAAGRGNIDGEPVQGSLADFVSRQAELLRPETVIFCHHDNWNPPRTREMDMQPIAFAIKDRAGSAVDVVEPTYGNPLNLKLG
jgi:L-ascorbate metabolism protein UlaG (beta-lactamase superfamily)